MSIVDKNLFFSDILGMTTPRTELFPSEDTLTRWLTQLQPPKQYFEGRSFRRTGLPDNILLFSRLSPKKLAGLLPHHHHRYVIILAWQGSGTIILNQHPIRLEPGHAVLIHPLQFHHYTDLSEDEFLWLYITFEADQQEDVANWRNLSVCLDERCYVLLRELAQLWG